MLSRNRDIRPSIIPNFFDTKNIVGHRRVPLRSFLVLWDNNFSIENPDNILLGLNIFVYRYRMKHRKVHLRKDWLVWSKTLLMENRDICFLSLIPNIFRYQITSETQKGSSKIFLDSLAREFLTENRKTLSSTPPP